MEPSILKKLLDKEESIVGWLAYIDAGIPVIHNIHWTLKNSPLHENYKVARILKGEDGTFLK